MRCPFCLRATSCAPRVKWPGSWPRRSPSPGPAPSAGLPRPASRGGRPGCGPRVQRLFSKSRNATDGHCPQEAVSRVLASGVSPSSKAGALDGGQEVSLDLTSGSGDTGRSSGSKSVLTAHVYRQDLSPHSHVSRDTCACDVCQDSRLGEGKSALRVRLRLLGRKMLRSLGSGGLRLQGQPARVDTRPRLPLNPHSPRSPRLSCGTPAGRGPARQGVFALPARLAGPSRPTRGNLRFCPEARVGGFKQRQSDSEGLAESRSSTSAS